jgi:anti-sigma factor RsiW
LRVQACFDGEADALLSAEMERHLMHCAECRTLLAEMSSLRTAMHQELPAFQASPDLRARVMRALDAETVPAPVPEVTRAASPVWRRRPSSSFLAGLVTGLAGAGAVAMAMVWLIATPLRSTSFADELVSAHVHSLMTGHLIEVESSDRHTVKPWFAGRTEVSPAVSDFASQGYPLVGGRIDVIRQQRVAVLVYRHGMHIITVYCWPAALRYTPENATRAGYHLAGWQSADLAYAAVSDTGWDELLGLERRLQALSADDRPP